ncbi:MAG: hypothetical protein KME27_00205 [Lyngbya sp. HA4199-MV5]|jgi:hypothetical protein|nr:hypothetical protein [Lyngbya sp. HA4199-MV5]
MKTSHAQTSVCRRCRYYEPEGRRGGHCQQLNVAVQGNWTACSLAIPPFSPAWETFEDIMVWQQKTLVAMQESERADASAAARCPELTIAQAVDDRAIAESSFNCTPPCGLDSPASAEPTPTKGLKALWM